MPIILTKKANSLLIQSQLDDGATDRRVFVILSNPDGSLAEPRFEIPHVINGDYRDETRVMPSDKSYLTAQYFVYQPNAIDLDDSYTLEKDIFVRDLTGEIIDEGGIGGASVTVVNGIINGEITDDNIEGLILDNEEISGIIESDLTILGEINEC